MTHGDSLTRTVEATHRSLEDRLAACLAPPGDDRPARETHTQSDAFLAATSRHVSAVEAVLLPAAGRSGPTSDALVHGYLEAARELEQTLTTLKARLYGGSQVAALSWPGLWAVVRQQLAEHNRLERALVELLQDAEPERLDALARQLFDAETRGPTRPHPHLPHTGAAGRVARRVWAVADRFWDSAEGRVIPQPVRAPAHRHDSLLAQYLVGDPHFDDSAKLRDRRHPPR
ncbi:MAG: hypothetical protein WB441_15305 [Nocardioidaceae bacterium]